MRRGVVFGPAPEVLRAALRETLPPAGKARRVRVKVPVRDVRDPRFAARRGAVSRRACGWSLTASTLPQARVAVRLAGEIFGPGSAAFDAVLGWLFARFPRFGARGSDMVAHHAMLKDERYYEGWVELCGRLQLFERGR
ncbi:MAG: hypothetical protein K2X97_06715 [Mycobacteriaceae bacterium]|nr:hypothetical protein [Mycobacteriaceae bacterium]